MSDPLEDLMGGQPNVTGANIATLRKAAGLTQEQLADRVNVSKSLLSKVEIGDRAATHALVATVARVLRLPIERIHGQPYSGSDVEEAHSGIDALRAALRAYDLPPTDGTTTTTSLDRLRTDVATVTRLRRAGRYTHLGQRLPALLTELGAALHTHTGADRRTLFDLLTAAYYTAHGLAHRLGYGDLAESIEHKLAWAAEGADDPLAIGLASWTRVTGFQDAGDYDHGLQILDHARSQVSASTADPADPATIVVLGSMHLRAATLASRAGDTTETQNHLDAARGLAGAFPADQRHYQLTFGPANVRIHATAAYIELGHPTEAIRLSERFAPPADIAPTRAGHHYIDLARAHLATGDRHAALSDLQRARTVAPEQTRHHPMVRETTRVLISLHRRSNPDLTQLASWLGLTT